MKFPKRQLARLLQRYPVIGYAAQWGVHRIQERISCGAVGVVIDQRDRILLVEHVFHPHDPWGLPGGWMNRNEDPQTTVTREIREETGLIVQPVCPLLIVRSPQLRHHLDVAWLCRYAGDPDAITLCDELTDYRWITLDEARTLRTTDFHMSALQQAFRLHTNI